MESLGNLAFAFLSILLEGLPFILLGTLVSGFIDVYLPQSWLDRWLPKSRVQSVLVGGCLGILFPVCECAIVPVIRRLIQKGLPVSCAITYMLAAPVVNPITIMSTLTAFSRSLEPYTMTSSRVLMAYLVAVIVGLVTIRMAPGKILRGRVLRRLQAATAAKEKAAAAGAPAPEKPSGKDDTRLVAAMRTAMHDCLDTGMYFVIGCLITAGFNIYLSRATIDSVAANDMIAIPVLMMFAFVSSLCSTSDAFIAATLQSFSTASKLAFLVFGPMVDVKLIFMYNAVFRAKFVLALVLGLFLLIGAFSLAWAQFF